MVTKYIFIALIGLLGCASMREQAVQTYCNQEGGYQKGMNDASAKKPMDNSFVQICAPEVRTNVMTAYREGYTKGLEMNKQEVPQSVINVNIGGASTGATNVRAYFCESHAFTSTYRAFGPTEIEARENVRSQCEKQNDAMFCKDATCRRN